MWPCGRLVHLSLLDERGQKRELTLEARLGVDDFVIRKACALAGLGFTVLPMLYCEEELANGTFIRILPQWSLPGGWLQAVYPHRRGVLPALRAWLDHLAEAFNGCGDRAL